MDRTYHFVVEDKHRNVIDKLNFTCDFDTAKNVLKIMMHLTGVRYGYIMEKSSSMLGSLFSPKKIYEDVIIHEGE